MTPVKPTLVMTIGLPRSGKSTWAMKQGVPVVNPDAIRLALHGRRFVAEAEPMVWALTRYMVDALFIAGHQRVILDATNTRQKRRDEWRSERWVREFMEFSASEATCMARTADPELWAVIERMSASFEPIAPVERDHQEGMNED